MICGQECGAQTSNLSTSRKCGESKVHLGFVAREGGFQFSGGVSVAFESKAGKVQNRTSTCPASPCPNFPGGDVLVADRETVLVGVSQRTNERGADRLAEFLFARTPVKRVVKVFIPKQRFSCSGFVGLGGGGILAFR